MSKPRIHVLALGGTIATRPDASGIMQMGARRRRPREGGALASARLPTSKLRQCRASAAIRSSFDQIHALAAKIRGRWWPTA